MGGSGRHVGSGTQLPYVAGFGGAAANRFGDAYRERQAPWIESGEWCSPDSFTSRSGLAEEAVQVGVGAGLGELAR